VAFDFRFPISGLWRLFSVDEASPTYSIEARVGGVCGIGDDDAGHAWCMIAYECTCRPDRLLKNAAICGGISV